VKVAPLAFVYVAPFEEGQVMDCAETVLSTEVQKATASTGAETILMLIAMVLPSPKGRGRIKYFIVTHERPSP